MRLLQKGHRCITEAWNNAFAGQVGHSYTSLYRLIDNLRKDNALVVVALEAESRGQPPRKRVRRPTRDLHERFFTAVLLADSETARNLSLNFCEVLDTQLDLCRPPNHYLDGRCVMTVHYSIS